MPNGKPGDHPLTDIVVHGLEVYGHEADSLIRRISKLSSYAELNEWWDQEVRSGADAGEIVQKAKARLSKLEGRGS